MSQTSRTPEGAPSVEESTPLGDPIALVGVEEALIGLANFCPVTLLGTKAVDALCGDDPSHERGRAERVLRSNVRFGYGIMLAGLFCPIFWVSYFAGVTGVELLWHAAASGLIALAGLALAGHSRARLGRLRRSGGSR